jgi:drug/metabolite transporter (DMT)-like permease
MAFYLPTLLGLSTAICWGTADYLSRGMSERIGSYRTAVYLHVMTFVFALALLPVLQPGARVGSGTALILVGAGALNFFAFILLYRAFHRGVVSVVAPIAYSYPAVTTVLSIGLLGAVLSPSRGLALACIMVGVILLSMKFSELKARRNGSRRALTPGVGAAVLSAFFFGLIYIGIGYVTPTAGFVLPVIFLRGVGAAVGFALAAPLKQSVRADSASFSPRIVAMGVLETVGFLGFNYGVSLGVNSLPVVAALSGMGGAIAMIYAAVHLRERIEPNQALGALLSLVGVFTILYLGA